jgi:hypothetical protein
VHPSQLGAVQAADVVPPEALGCRVCTASLALQLATNKKANPATSEALPRPRRGMFGFRSTD